jgi:histidinol-phosphate aminotransferase
MMPRDLILSAALASVAGFSLDGLMSRFWVKKVEDLVPYVPGEQPISRSLVKLNTNEHALEPSRAVMAAIADMQADQLRRYPDPLATDLRSAIADMEGLSPEQVFVGNGSDEVLAHMWLACLSGRTVQTLDTTYGFYPVWAGLYDSPLVEVPLRPDFSVDMSVLRESSHAIVLANPNAPTGMALSRAEIESLVISNRDRLVIIDEAYHGFGAETAAPLVTQYDNLIISRSLSKSHALAGMRVGYALAHPELIGGLNRVKDSFNSYPLDAVAQAAAAAAIRDREWLQRSADVVIGSRETMRQGLLEQGFDVLPSDANFVFAKHAQVPGKILFEALRSRDVLVRRWEKPRIIDWLRISVGTPEQTDQLLKAVADSLQAGA